MSPVALTMPDTMAATPFQQLSEAARNYLPEMLRSCLDEDKTTRREEVRKVWELRLFAKGVQQLFYDEKGYVFYALTPQNVSFDLPTHRGVFDITSPHKRSFVSILSENPPGINFVANDLANSKDVSAATAAEKQRAVVDRMVPMKKMQAKVAGRFCTDGRVTAWTRLDNGVLKVDLYGVLETKVPPYAEAVEDFDYCVLARETNLWKAKSDNPEFAEKITATDTTASYNTFYERYARLSVVARKGNFADSFKNLVTEYQCFVRPWRYLKAPDPVQQELEMLFPDGLCLHAYGSTVVDAVPETMDSLAIEFPVDDEGQMQPPLLNGMPYIQRAYNDYRNQQRDSADYAVQRTWVHGGAVDGEAIEEQETAQGVVHIINPPNSMSVQDCFGIEPAVQIPDWSMLMQSLKADGENLTGDFPSLYGGDTPGQDTVGVNRLLNNQAKGQLGPAWAAEQRLYAKIYQVAIPLSAQITKADSVAVKGKNGQESYNPQAILEGQFYCHPDQDSSFPQTTADKRASFAQLSQDIASMGDAGAAILAQPRNLQMRVQLAGLPEFFIPAAAAGAKALRQIERCLAEDPVPIMEGPAFEQWKQVAAAAEQAGVKPPDQPTQCSVHINPKRDFLEAMQEAVDDWFSSDAQHSEEQKWNVLGLQNVELYAQSIDDALAAKAAQNKPQGPPMGITAAFKDLDPATKVQALVRDGYQPTEGYYEAGAMQDAQGKSAETQETAANATHKAVLAAREAVAPHRVTPPAPPKSPDQAGGLR